MGGLNLLILFSLFLFVFCRASLISLTSSENVITPPLTRTMEMNCALFDTEKSPTGSIGSVSHDNSEKILTGRNGQKANCPEVTSTSSDVSFVTSIVLMRNGVETIASVTQLDPIQWQTSISSLSVVKGNLSRSSTGMKGYVELKWDYPSATDSGNYTCEVNAITREGHNVAFTETVTVKHSTASIDDVTKSVAALYKQMEQLVVAVAAGKARHSEQGVLSCGSSDSWENSNGREMFVDQTQTFSKAYESKPLVQIGVINVDSSGETGYGSNPFGVELVGVSEKGFTIRCFTNNYREYLNGYSINDMKVSWLSVAH